MKKDISRRGKSPQGARDVVSMGVLSVSVVSSILLVCSVDHTILTELNNVDSNVKFNKDMCMYAIHDNRTRLEFNQQII